MPKGLTDYFPEKSGPTAFVQARVPNQLFLEVRQALNARGISWAAFVRASMERFLDELSAGVVRMKPGKTRPSSKGRPAKKSGD